jgi:hypothetical protein
MDQIAKLVEEEVEKRVNERLKAVLEKISKTYDISLRQLVRDLDTIAEAPSTCCKGLKKNGTRCSFMAKTDGYCNRHLDQKPVLRIKRTPSVTTTMATAHTHTLPPLFLAGCPACEKSRSTNNLSLLAMCA